MLDLTQDIQSLTTFRRRSAEFLKHLKKSKRPVVLTVKGKAAAIVQDAAAYQRLLDIAAAADPREGIRQGLDDVRERPHPQRTRVLCGIRCQTWPTSLAWQPAPNATWMRFTNTSRPSSLPRLYAGLMV